MNSHNLFNEDLEFIKYFIPIFTFVLGMIFQIYLYKRSKKENLKQEHIKEIAELSTEWYNQIHASFIEDLKKDSLELIDYHFNRSILPKYLRSLEVIKQYKDCQKMTTSVEQFLFLLTNNKNLENNQVKENFFLTFNERKNKYKENDFMRITCNRHDRIEKCIVEYYTMKDIKIIFSDKDIKIVLSGLSQKELILSVLDKIIQEINIEAGKLLK